MTPTKGNSASSKARSTASKSASGRQRYSKWIDGPNEHADRKGQSLATRDHNVIKRWAEERGGKPATIPSQKNDPRVLRLDFPGYGGRSLAQIGWDKWFKNFDDRDVVFVYQEQLRNGNQSNFFRLTQDQSRGRRAA